MIKQMQGRFVRIAMLSFTAVLLCLLLGLNGLNYWQTVQELDGEASHLIDQSQNQHQGNQERPPLPKNQGFDWARLWQSYQEPNYHTARYIYAKTDADGKLVTSQLDRMDDYDQGTLANMLSPLLKSSKNRGWIGVLRYYQRTNSQGEKEWLFVDAGRQLQAVTRLAMISLGILVLTLLIVYGLLRYFSNRAIRPLINNIKRQQEFISNASHEINTPLAVLATNNDVLELTGCKNEWTQSNRRQIQRLNALVEQMLQLARYDEGRVALNPESLDLVALLKQALGDLGGLLEANRAQVSLNLPDSILLTIDRASFQQVSQVLLENALQYHLAGTEIEVGWRQTDKSLFVANHCQEMSQEQAERLFERFYRPDQGRQRDQGGSGMGLSLAQAVAERNGWHLKVGMRSETEIEFTIRF